VSNRLLTVEETAERLNVTTRWVRRAISERTLEVVHLGRLVRLPEDGLTRYVESRRTPARKEEVGAFRQLRNAR
jgi:excisionase family DNA binding protein